MICSVRPAFRPTLRATVAAATLLALAAEPADAQRGTRADPFTSSAQVTAVELVVSVEDGSGRVPEDLGLDDFEVLEDGVPVELVGVETWRRGTVVRRAAPGAPERVETSEEPLWTWHSVIYFDQVLSSSRSIRRAAAALAERARQLTQLGTVEIVAANPTARQILAPTRSSPLVEQTLLEISRTAAGRDEIRRLRSQLVHEQQLTGAGRFRVTKLNSGVAQESQLLGRQHDVLMSVVSASLHQGPRALLLVNDGYDMRPEEFYFSLRDGSVDLDARVTSAVGERGAAYDVEELAKTLAGAGWVTLNMALGSLDAATTTGAEHLGRGRSGGAGSLDLGPANTSDILARGPDAVFVSPLGPLRHLAVATGGDVLTGVQKLPVALEALEDKVRLTYQVARVPDGKLHRVEVRARRPGLKVQAPRWAGASAPEGVSAARARRLLAGGADRGDLPLEAAIALQPAAEDDPASAGRHGKLQARVDLRDLKASLPSGGAPVRMTVAASFAEGEPFVHHDLIEGQTLAGLDAWTYALPLALPRPVDRVSVVFEELATGTWGGAVAAIVEGELPAAVQALGASDGDPADGAIPQDLLPERKAILLLPPAETVVRGKVLLEPVIGNPRIARVEYLIDGEPAASSEKPPFSARVDFGSLPAPRRIEAVGLGADGIELGRDALSVNEGVGAFGVRIIEPRSGERMGSVDVEAEVRLPGGPAALDRVEVHWNGERVATLFEPPFRSRVFVAPEAPVGYVSVTAHRTDGTTAEDVVFLNGTGPADRVDVKLVELFTVVQDPAERPVRGLERGVFRVYEDGSEQPIADFRAGAEMPLSLGFLMDTSASMTPSMRAAQAAAIDFLLLALRENDQAFVVGFDARPRLVQPLTAERSDLVDAIAGLRAGGTSALCDALVFSLVHMQRVPGRRALVVLTDGVGREERVDFGTCLRFVQRSGVPVYAILLAGDDPTATRAGGVDTQKLDRLVEVVGGRLFVAEDAARLGGVYRSVIEELRSQYLLTYYPARTAAARSDEWREVAVEVDDPGMVARTIAGYYP